MSPDTVELLAGTSETLQALSDKLSAAVASWPSLGAKLKVAEVADALADIAMVSRDAVAKRLID